MRRNILICTILIAVIFTSGCGRRGDANESTEAKQNTDLTEIQQTRETLPEREAEPAAKEDDETFYGVLIDEDCSDFEEPSMHDLPCMLMYACRDSGYGLDILQPDGSYAFYMFDRNGQELAWQYLNETTRMSDLYVTVTGKREDNLIKVKTLEES